MPIYSLSLLAKKYITKNIMECTFTKPEGFTFKPGQYAGFTLNELKKTNPQQATRRFSLLSTPHDPHIMFATRMQPSPYKQALGALPVDAGVTLAGPSGQFTLHESSEPAVFIAGGIGIAPFYSIIRDTLFHQVPRDLTLFYGNESLEEAAYFTELQQLSKEHTHFKLIPVFTHPTPHWQGETGWITDDILKRHIPNLTVPIYYVCGGPKMVRALQECLKDMGINEAQIKLEDFPGYV